MKTRLTILAASLVLVACTSGSDNKKMTGAAGTGAGTAGTGTAGAGTGAAGNGAAGTGTGAAGTGAAGTTGAAGGGAAGTSGAAGMGAAGTTGAAGAGTDGGAGSSGGGTDASSAQGDGPVTTAGCANHNYQLCIDFENGIDTATWTGGNPAAIVTNEVAHGTHAYHLYSDVKGTPLGGVLKTTKMGTIKDQLWGRFYIHFKPGAPGGHGNILGAYDQSNNWYEIGWQFDGILGVWHGGGGERPTASLPLLVDQWYCVESFFDGTKTNMPQWWIDGTEAQYILIRNTALIPKVVMQFMTITVGWTPYAGLGLQMPDGRPPVDPRQLNDAWIDDIALDTQRIGCIQ